MRNQDGKTESRKLQANDSLRRLRTGEISPKLPDLFYVHGVHDTT